MSKSNNPDENERMTFWEHLEVFRHILFRCLAIWGVCSIAAFCFKNEIFQIIFAPSRNDFILYRLLCRLAEATSISSLCPGDFHANFINTQLTSQFMTHLGVSMCVGVIIAMPYLIYKLYGFVSPALYQHERKYSFVLIFSSFVLFGMGILLNYFVIFPFSFRFLSTYQVQDFVVNQIALSSYTSTLLVLSLLLGIVFEIPILAYFLTKLGVINHQLMRNYRRHAFVVICILAAIITPTADIFTLLLVACPIALLYEFSIRVVKKVE